MAPVSDPKRARLDAPTDPSEFDKLDDPTTLKILAFVDSKGLLELSEVNLRFNRLCKDKEVIYRKGQRPGSIERLFNSNFFKNSMLESSWGAYTFYDNSILTTNKSTIYFKNFASSNIKEITAPNADSSFKITEMWVNKNYLFCIQTHQSALDYLSVMDLKTEKWPISIPIFSRQLAHWIDDNKLFWQPSTSTLIIKNLETGKSEPTSISFARSIFEINKFRFVQNKADNIQCFDKEKKNFNIKTVAPSNFTIVNSWNNQLVLKITGKQDQLTVLPDSTLFLLDFDEFINSISMPGKKIASLEFQQGVSPLLTIYFEDQSRLAKKIADIEGIQVISNTNCTTKLESSFYLASEFRANKMKVFHLSHPQTSIGIQAEDFQFNQAHTIHQGLIYILGLEQEKPLIKVWNLYTGELIKTLEFPDLTRKPHQASISFINNRLICSLKESDGWPSDDLYNHYYWDVDFIRNCEERLSSELPFAHRPAVLEKILTVFHSLPDEMQKEAAPLFQKLYTT